MKRCVFLFLTVFAVFGLSAEEKEIRIEIDGTGEKAAAVKESEIAETGVFVFSFKKQVGLFADNVTVEDAVKGFEFYSEVRKKADFYRKEEERKNISKRKPIAYMIFTTENSNLLSEH